MYLPRRWPTSSAAGPPRSVISRRSIAMSRLATITSSWSKSGRIRVSSSISSSASWHPPCEIERYPEFKEDLDAREASSTALAPRRTPCASKSALGALSRIGSPGRRELVGILPGIGVTPFRPSGVPEGGCRCRLLRHFPVDDHDPMTSGWLQFNAPQAPRSVIRFSDPWGSVVSTGERVLATLDRRPTQKASLDPWLSRRSPRSQGRSYLGGTPSILSA